MIRLGIDTSTSLVQVAVCSDEAALSVFDSPTNLRHGEDLAPAIAGTLSAAGLAPDDLGEIVVGVGPGPFTGLRVGLVTARTMGFALGIPVVGVCSLDVIAHAAVEADPTMGDGRETTAGDLIVATDARRKEVYVARYAAGKRVEGPSVLRPADAATTLPTAGEGALLYPDDFPNAIAPAHPSAAVLCQVVASGSVELLPPEPLYLRRPDTMPPRPPKRVS